MALMREISICPLSASKGGSAEFYPPQVSDETMLVQIPAATEDSLFVHQFQTDQLLVVRGQFVLVVLQNRRYHYLGLSEAYPTIVTIPKGIPHGAVNLSSEPCVLVNAVLRHGPPHPKDYRPVPAPFPYDRRAVEVAQAQPVGALLSSPGIKSCQKTAPKP